jgi:hypothetical protein
VSWRGCSHSFLVLIILHYPLLQIWVKPEGRRQLLPVFHKLSLVNLFNISEECDLTWTMFILQGAPTLKKLCIMVNLELILNFSFLFHLMLNMQSKLSLFYSNFP